MRNGGKGSSQSFGAGVLSWVEAAQLQQTISSKLSKACLIKIVFIFVCLIDSSVIDDMGVSSNKFRTGHVTRCAARVFIVERFVVHRLAYRLNGVLARLPGVKRDRKSVV